MRIDIKGLVPASLMIKSLASALPDEGSMTQAAAILLANTRKRFLEETAPDGSRWVQSLAAMRRAADPEGGGGTLFDTGTLFHGIMVRKPGPLQRAIYASRHKEIGRKHQYGLDGQLQRVFLGFSDHDVTVIEKLVKARLEKIK